MGKCKNVIAENAKTGAGAGAEAEAEAGALNDSARFNPLSSADIVSFS